MQIDLLILVLNWREHWKGYSIVDLFRVHHCTLFSSLGFISMSFLSEIFNDIVFFVLYTPLGFDLDTLHVVLFFIFSIILIL